MSEPLVIALVRCYSPSTRESGAVDHLVAWMRARGFDARVDEAGNAVGIRGPQDAPHTLMLLGHIDTVRGEIPVRVENNILYGRGSVDAKGSLCAFAEAAAAAAVLPPGWRVVVVGAVEEEISTSRGARHIREQFDPNLCIIGEPSGIDRLTLGYKGCLTVDYALSRAVVHSSCPEPGVGALGVQFWHRVSRWTETQNEGFPRLFDQVTPRLQAINTSSDDFYETVAVQIRFRLPPRLAPDVVAAAVAQFAEPDARFYVHSAETAYQGGKNTPLVRGLLAAIRAQGIRPGFVLKGGTSDMNVVGTHWRCPIVAYGPGDSSLDHTPDEHLRLNEYAQAVAVLRHFIEHLDAGADCITPDEWANSARIPAPLPR